MAKSIPASIEAISDIVDLAVSDFKAKKSYMQIAGDLFLKLGATLKAAETLNTEVAAFGLGASIGLGLGMGYDSIVKKVAAVAADSSTAVQ